MKIQVVNHSTVVGPSDFLNMVAACGLQAREEFSEAWARVPPTIEACLDGVIDPDAYTMGIFDTSDQPGALGYHDYDDQGKPVGYVFAKTTADNDGSISVTLSHEILEMILDPSCTLWTQATDGAMRALEACDAVEEDEYTKTVGGVAIKVSNFLTPNYFSAIPILGLKTDYLDKLHGRAAPAMTPGGYDIVQNTVGQPTQEFSRMFAALPDWKARAKTHPKSRTGKRAASLRPR